MFQKIIQNKIVWNCRITGKLNMYHFTHKFSFLQSKETEKTASLCCLRLNTKCPFGKRLWTAEILISKSFCSEFSFKLSQKLQRIKNSAGSALEPVHTVPKILWIYRGRRLLTYRITAVYLAQNYTYCTVQIPLQLYQPWQKWFSADEIQKPRKA